MVLKNSSVLLMASDGYGFDLRFLEKCRVKMPVPMSRIQRQGVFHADAIDGAAKANNPHTWGDGSK